MTDYPPNKLVAALAKVLVPDARGKAVGVAQGGTTAASDDAVTDALAGDPSVPELVTFAGFLGGAFTDKNDTTWRFLYLDPKLVTWLVVNEDDIVLHRQLRDIAMPTADDSDEKAILRDLIWLRSSASVTEGSGPPRTHEIEAQFLRGDFIGAGDFSASLTGGTFSRATGLLCEVQTPGCCGRYTRPRP